MRLGGLINVLMGAFLAVLKEEGWFSCENLASPSARGISGYKTGVLQSFPPLSLPF
jgi:hypothetical protein